MRKVSNPQPKLFQFISTIIFCILVFSILFKIAMNIRNTNLPFDYIANNVEQIWFILSIAGVSPSFLRKQNIKFSKVV